MHYKNGREAKNGDRVVMMPAYGDPVVGMLYDAVAGNDACNGRIAPISQSNSYANLAECLHIDDAKAALASVVKPPAETPAPEEPKAGA